MITDGLQIGLYQNTVSFEKLSKSGQLNEGRLTSDCGNVNVHGVSILHNRLGTFNAGDGDRLYLVEIVERFELCLPPQQNVASDPVREELAELV